mgnify:CR=1 FL=1
MKAYKAFNHDMTCRGFQFEIGKTYTHAGEVSLCNAGFHACEAPLDVLGYYPPTAMFAEVELGGVSNEKSSDTKRVGKSITVKDGLNIAGLVSAQIEWVSKQDDANISSGNSSTAASSGNSSTAASSGYSSKASADGKQTVAMVAGCYGQAKAGINGAFALAYKDDEQMRIAVGIVGEDGILADTWYRVDAGKLVQA